jgi:hypothetical protein
MSPAALLPLNFVASHTCTAELRGAIIEDVKIHRFSRFIHMFQLDKKNSR